MPGHNCKIEISYFTDVLCIWAYIAQIRMDELQHNFAQQIQLKQHFIPVFGSVALKTEQVWKHQGGLTAYNKHIHELVAKFPHIDVHPDIWLTNTPTTSGNSHLFLKAVQILEQRGELDSADDSSTSLFEQTIWQFRLAFFKQLINISHYSEQATIAETLGLPLGKIEQLINNGEAFAALDEDFQLRDTHRVTGSPSLVFNEGRQLIYGNVGYRVIEANIQELLKQPDNQRSWC